MANGNKKISQKDFLLSDKLINHKNFIVDDESGQDYIPFFSIVQNFAYLEENETNNNKEDIVDKDIEANKFYFHFLQSFYYYAFETVYFSIFHCKTDDSNNEDDNIRLEQKTHIIKECEHLKPYFEFLEPLTKKEPIYKQIAYSLGVMFFSYTTKDLHNMTTEPINAKREIERDVKILNNFKEIIKHKTSIPYYVEWKEEIASGEDVDEIDQATKSEILKFSHFNEILEQIEKDLKELHNKKTAKVIKANKYYKIPNDRSQIEKALYSINMFYELNATDHIRSLLNEMTKLKNKIAEFTHTAFRKEVAKYLSSK